MAIVAPPDYENLPHGWSKKEDPNTGKVYYLDHKTRTTHWNNPDKNLPHGWHTVQNDQGKTYYQNDDTRATQWEPPT